MGIFDDANFGAESEVKSQVVDWGKAEDFFVGTFVKAQHNIETEYGKNSMYQFIIEKGSFHKLTKKVPAATPTALNKGELWGVWGRNDLFNGQMNSLRPGQVVKLTFAETRETSAGEAKIIKIFAPKNNDGSVVLNQEWLDSQSVTAGDMPTL